MYETRLRRLLAVFLVLFGVIAGRAFALQVLRVDGPEKDLPWAEMAGQSRSFVVYPRRGDIHWADGSKMAWNVPSYGLEILWGEVDHRIVPTLEELRAAYPKGLSAANSEVLTGIERDLVLLRDELLDPEPDGTIRQRWRCTVCGTERAAVGKPSDPRDACRDCGLVSYEETEPVDAAELAALLGISEHKVNLALVRAICRWRQNEGWRSHALFVRVRQSAVDAIDLYPQKFGGFLTLARNGREFDPVARPLTGGTRLPDKGEATALAAACVSGPDAVWVEPEHFYPTLIGSSLLEGAMDRELRGTPGRHERVLRPDRDFELETRVLRAVEDGAELHTTLRRDLQALARRIVEENAPPEGHGAAVVLDVRSGAVLALASTSRDAMDHARSHVIPGSVYKLVTAIALLEAGHSPDETRHCAKTARIPAGGRYTCSHFDRDVALHDAFVRSCNGYFAQQAVAVGAAALARAARRLGLGDGEDCARATELGVVPHAFLEDRLGGGTASRCGLALSCPEENPEHWKIWNLSQIGIGQGAASASPLHIAVAYARIASGGRRLRPFVLERDRPAPGAIDVDPVLTRWAPLLRDAARDVVFDEEHGTARRIDALREVRAAGKTGTAEVGKKGSFLNNASFVGFAPYDDPRYCAVVMLERMPEKVYGADAAGEPVARLLAEALREQ